MVDVRTVGLQHRWVAVGALFTAGFTLAFLTAVSLPLSDASPWFGVAGMGAAALAGSYVTARVSPLRRALEPVTGALGFFAVLTCVVLFALGDIEAIGRGLLRSFDVTRVAVTSSAIALGAVLGARWGRRGEVARPTPAVSGVLAVALVGGAVVTLVLITALPALVAGSEPATGILIVALFGGVFAGSVAAQAIAPARRIGSIATGVALGFGLPGALPGLLNADSPIGATLGVVLLWLPVLGLIAAAGARVGWGRAEKHRARVASQALAARVVE